MADNDNIVEVETTASPNTSAVALSDDDEFDIHVCGRCKNTFNDLSKYIEHKKAKTCTKTKEPCIESTTDQVELIPYMGEGVEMVTIVPLTPEEEPAEDHADVKEPPHPVNSDPTEQAPGLPDLADDSSASKPRRRKRKNSTPKTTRKPVRAMETPHAEVLIQPKVTGATGGGETITVHIPESQLVHLGASTPVGGKGVRKQGATSVFVPIYLTSPTRSAFKCSKCPAEFRSKEERDEHSNMHKKNYKCDDCNKRYFSYDALEAHKQTESHSHTCDECGKVFHSQIYLKRHKTVHVEERNFPCEICNKAYTSDANLKAHKRSVHCIEKKHKCEECGKAFARKDKLKRHQLIHIPYPNRPVFPCPFRSHTGCTSTFYREDKLKRHLFTHSKEKPYKCQECGKGFARRDNMNDHIKTHTKEFSHICPLCDRGFLGPAKIKKHLKSVHEIKDAAEQDNLVQQGKQPTPVIVAPSVVVASMAGSREPGEVQRPPVPQGIIDGKIEDEQLSEEREKSGGFAEVVKESRSGEVEQESSQPSPSASNDSDATVEDVNMAEHITQAITSSMDVSIHHDSIMNQAITTAISRPVSLLNRPSLSQGVSDLPTQVSELPSHVFIPPMVPTSSHLSHMSDYSTGDIVTMPSELVSLVRGCDT
ncbi:MDS1 and EVI1 complex locus protein EVI1-B [Nematostella vectensis]|nr:MDS1 and EVI1 complex locus protein EVI1-B [Nematostella vectensis]